MIGASELPLAKGEIIGARELVSEYQFELHAIPVAITLRLYKRVSEGDVEVRQSHFIRTPLQSEALVPEKSWYPNVAAALQEAINSFTVCYNEAIQEGCAPDASWLVANEAF